MGSYRETNDEPKTFYVDTFGSGQQLEIIEVIRQIGGQVEYDRAARHLDEARARYRIMLPAGCEHAGLDEHMAPQTITLPGGSNMRKLCLYPQDDSVHLAWLPGDSAESSMWDGARRKPEYASDNEEDVEAEHTETRPTDVVTPHLELEAKHITEKTPKFAEALTRFLADQSTPVQWLRISNLRMMAQSLKDDYERIDGLLAILEQRTEKHSDA